MAGAPFGCGNKFGRNSGNRVVTPFFVLASMICCLMDCSDSKDNAFLRRFENLTYLAPFGKSRSGVVE